MGLPKSWTVVEMIDDYVSEIVLRIEATDAEAVTLADSVKGHIYNNRIILNDKEYAHHE